MQATKGIPTEYKSYRFRSRLEARWARFFDLLGWRWEYEPVDFNGWIPDFAIYGDCGNIVYVEVKPVIQFPKDVANKIDASGCQDDVLIVGQTVPLPDTSKSPGPTYHQEMPCPFGWIGSHVREDPPVEVNGSEHDHYWFWDFANLFLRFPLHHREVCDECDSIWTISSYSHNRQDASLAYDVTGEIALKKLLFSWRKDGDNLLTGEELFEKDFRRLQLWKEIRREHVDQNVAEACRLWALAANQTQWYPVT